MVGLTNSYTTVAVIPEVGNSIRVINANTGAYTVPTGKKGKVKGQMNLDAVGADATYAIAVKRGAVFYPVGAHVAINGESTIQGEITLQAGEILTNIGDSGSTNGTADITYSVQEVDV